MIREDPNQYRWQAIYSLNEFQPKYWHTLFKYAESFFGAMRRPELIDEMTKMIRVKVEIPMGSPIYLILYTYDNLPSLNAFTRSLNPAFEGKYIYKYTIESWLKEIERWIFQRIMEIEPTIRFTRIKEM